MITKEKEERLDGLEWMTKCVKIIFEEAQKNPEKFKWLKYSVDGVDYIFVDADIETQEEVKQAIEPGIEEMLENWDKEWRKPKVRIDTEIFKVKVKGK